MSTSQITFENEWMNNGCTCRTCLSGCCFFSSPVVVLTQVAKICMWLAVDNCRPSSSSSSSSMSCVSLYVNQTLKHLCVCCVRRWYSLSCRHFGSSRVYTVVITILMVPWCAGVLLDGVRMLGHTISPQDGGLDGVSETILHMAHAFLPQSLTDLECNHSATTNSSYFVHMLIWLFLFLLLMMTVLGWM
jgi:hypothetical protein